MSCRKCEECKGYAKKKGTKKCGTCGHAQQYHTGNEVLDTTAVLAKPSLLSKMASENDFRTDFPLILRTSSASLDASSPPSSSTGSTSQISFTLPPQQSNFFTMPKTPHGEKGFLDVDETLWSIVGGALYGLGLKQDQVNTIVKGIETNYFADKVNSVLTNEVHVENPLHESREPKVVESPISGVKLRTSSVADIPTDSEGGSPITPRSSLTGSSHAITPRGSTTPRNRSGSNAGTLSSNFASYTSSNPPLTPEKKLTFYKNIYAYSKSFLEQQAVLYAVTNLQSLTRGWLARQKIKATYKTYVNNPLGRRNEGFRDLLKTESRFITHLELIVLEYMMPLKKAAESKKTLILAPEDIDNIFSNIGDVLKVHKKLYSELCRIRLKWPRVHGVGKVFISMGTDFVAYKEFVNNFHNSQNILVQSQSKNSKFATFLEETYKRTQDHGLGLFELLGVPLNRIASYNNLLERLLTNSEVDSRDYKKLRDAHTTMSQMYQIVSESIENALPRAQILEVERKVEGCGKLIKNKRVLLKEGAVTIILDKINGKKKQRYIFLFNDLVLITKKLNKTNYKAERPVDLFSCTVTPVDDPKLHPVLMEGITIINPNMYTPKDVSASPHSEKCPKTFICFGSKDEKKEWLSLFLERTEIYVETKLKIFGRPLAEIISHEEKAFGPAFRKNNPTLDIPQNVPMVVIKCVQFLDKHLKLEGLFRVAPPQSELVDLKNRIDATVDTLDISKEDPHSVAGLLKMFLRELPEPVLTFQFYEKIVMSDTEILTQTSKSKPSTNNSTTTSSLSTGGTGIDKAAMISQIMQTSEDDEVSSMVPILGPAVHILPVINQKVLKYILMFLGRVAKESGVNRMTPYNLSIVFGPSLLRPREDTIETSIKSPKVNLIVQSLVEHWETLFAYITTEEDWTF